MLTVLRASFLLRNLKLLASRDAVSIANNVGINPIAIQAIVSYTSIVNVGNRRQISSPEHH